MNTGTVASFDPDQGWGTITSEALPPGALAWVHYSAIEARGFRELVAGEAVLFDFERAEQDGFHHRATRVIRSAGPVDDVVR